MLAVSAEANVTTDHVNSRSQNRLKVKTAHVLN